MKAFEKIDISNYDTSLGYIDLEFIDYIVAKYKEYNIYVELKAEGSFKAVYKDFIYYIFMPQYLTFCPYLTHDQPLLKKSYNYTEACYIYIKKRQSKDQSYGYENKINGCECEFFAFYKLINKYYLHNEIENCAIILHEFFDNITLAPLRSIQQQRKKYFIVQEQRQAFELAINYIIGNINNNIFDFSIYNYFNQFSLNKPIVLYESKDIYLFTSAPKVYYNNKTFNIVDRIDKNKFIIYGSVLELYKKSAK